MGLRGPVPKSAGLREYEGGAAHRPLPLPSARESAVFGIPERPKGMPSAARGFWTFYMGQMLANGTLRPIDGPCLEMICCLHADLQQLAREKRKLIRQRKAVAKEAGRTIEGGALLEFEVSTEGRRLETTLSSKRSALKQLCDRYGLNPLAGSRLQSVEAPMMPPGRPAMDVGDELEASIQ
jgi:hypothetical protein